MSKKSHFFSVVFEIHDSEAFKELSGDITDSLANETILKGAKVVACGLGDYGTASDAYAQELREQGVDPDDALHCYLRDAEGLEGQTLLDRIKAVNG